MSSLQAVDLVREFRVRGRRDAPLRAVDGVSFTITSGATVALVGASGSGKSTVARVLSSLDRPTAGHVLLDGEPRRTDSRSLRAYRKVVQMVFQDPFASLNPVKPVRHLLGRPLRIHRLATDADAERRGVLELLERVSLRPVEQFVDKLPHELSGGQRQRVAIARALAARPRILIADEPVSMLDVSVRLDILTLIERLKREDDLAVLYITHDLATARHFSTSIMVMNQGRIVEHGDADQIIFEPADPYTRRLAEAAPDPWRTSTGPP
ncbi:(GlcNAc)2 ABC transporter, ATP-binding component 2 [Pseudonocardia sp. Ae168_Ps1]|uniref:ABC transporter ATP-binding protein n=1 Tax=unclassified Pseudonocardia TaxID=2619320 RepID=UPI00094ABD4E|nr:MULTISPECIES: ATP-binding cassette domain-containing protein [unclassified Pseudonocardia]OLL76233.1 (GlcNAc)2 ABC transporter, ATP-binding component 2 [Pseudonocardia sp. Ae150A_Ps1]OLL82232.1 (GlcNAc)2 ABC transporter, ATP-binding component 2 [Pseudonocardia sp. Ae168_Ps1]OLL83652.1 (GlcNAc)2 ABC transporter, ATP-binding component 2 [Pseudonocardia sp. Ae263_Ps1]OLL90307.1 (GlcNAc)2 ABC transporter, ATP-binding component 2 [Pseudonocardia sp. Ae356_Ps1]